MKQELISNWPKWVILLSAIVIAAVLSSKAATIDSNVLPANYTQDINVQNKVIVPLTGKDRSQPTTYKKPVLNITALTEDTVFLFGEVGAQNAESISQQIISLNSSKSKDPILLVIDSPGGSVLDGAKVVSALEGSRRPVFTVCYGICASMAAMIHQYGTKRFMVNRSVVMFHNASGGVEGEMNKMLSRLHMVNDFVNKMDVYVANRAGIKFKDFQTMEGDELWLDAEDALNLSFSDQTVIINLTKIKKDSLLPFNNYKKRVDNLIFNDLVNKVEVK
jgi:ATP-dependent Clp endopeptidase proteolytic subunit ClpP